MALHKQWLYGILNNTYLDKNGPEYKKTMNVTSFLNMNVMRCKEIILMMRYMALITPYRDYSITLVRLWVVEATTNITFFIFNQIIRCVYTSSTHLLSILPLFSKFLNSFGPLQFAGWSCFNSFILGVLSKSNKIKWCKRCIDQN